MVKIILCPLRVDTNQVSCRPGETPVPSSSSTPNFSSSSLQTDQSETVGTVSQAGILSKKDDKIVVPPDSSLFGEIINKMQWSTTALQLQGVPLNLAIAFLLEVTVALENVDMDKLRKAGYSFEFDGNYVHIICKTFHDGGADEVIFHINSVAVYI